MNKKLMTMMLVTAMTVSATACGGSNNTAPVQSTETEQQTTIESEDTQSEAPVAQESAVTDFVTTEYQAGENKTLLCYPTPNAQDTLGVGVTCTAPVFIVYADGALDEETAKTYALESGLADIAAKEGSAICFVNPQGDSWSEADLASYIAIASNIQDSSTSTKANGLTENFNFMTQETSTGITGTAGRIYVYGIGAGADFVASNLIKPVVDKVTFPDGFSMEKDYTATGITVSDLSTVDGIEPVDFPIVSIGNSDEINEALKGVSANVLVEAEADYITEYASTISTTRRQVGVTLPVYNWADEGITEVIETYTVKTSEDNASEFAGSEEHPVGVVTYYANDLDVENGNVPLVLCFHGGGNTALYEAQATEWPLIGKEHGFITASVDLHFPNCSPTEIIDLINQLEEKYSINPGKIYASGFSMGGCKSWDLFEQYPNVFAGLAPMDATNELGKDSWGNDVAEMNSDVLMPVFYVGGDVSFLPELPFQDQKCIDRIVYAFDVNNVTTPYDVKLEDAANWKNPIWGVDGDIVYQVTDTKAFLDSTMTVNLFPSEDGKYYTALANSGNQNHEVYARNSWAAWDFLSQFTREEDGSISIAETTYSLASDDGSVVDNSYNMK